MAVFRDLGQTYAAQLGFLMRWSGILASCLDKQEIFQRLGRAAVPFLADWCSIVVREPDGSFVRVAVTHVDPEVNRRMRAVPGDKFLPKATSAIGIPRAIRTGKSELLRKVEVSEVLKELSVGEPDPEIRRKLTSAGLSSMMTTPLAAHGDVIGAMSMYNRSERAPFQESDLALAEELSRRAAQTLYTLIRLETAGHELERFEAAMRLYRDFVVSRVEDTRTPLTAGRLKVELLALKPSKDRHLLRKTLVDIDRAVEIITSVADESVFEGLMSEAKALKQRKKKVA